MILSKQVYNVILAKKLNSFKWYREILWIYHYRQLRDCKLLVLDVDGVLTNGSLHYEGMNINRNFCVNDGIGIKLLIKYGIQVAIISGGKGDSIEIRAKDLEIENCFVGIKDKLETLKKIQKKLNITKKESIFVGDDINDLIVKSEVSLLIAPLNGNFYIGEAVNCVTNNNGGRGAVREVCDRILKSKRIKFKNKNLKITN